jgi:hypothetical protein
MLKRLLQTYQQCARGKHVVIATPDHVQSLQLKCIELCCQQADSDAGRTAIALQRWLQEHVRDVLDEADDVLHVKRQLVYTLGAQQPPEGGDLRWRAIIGILALVCQHGQALAQRFGTNVVECTPLVHLPSLRLPRLLDHPEADVAFSWLTERVLDGWFNGDLARHDLVLPLPALPATQQAIVRAFILEPSVPPCDAGKFDSSGVPTNLQPGGVVEAFYSLPSSQQEEPLAVVSHVLRGLFAYGTLRSVLTRRWRVEFGVNPLGSRRMAVPFCAKDKAKANTEFGHVDVAVLLTLMSYYRSGLSECDFELLVSQLQKRVNAANIYKSWIDFAREYGQDIPPEMDSFEQLVLEDPRQMKKVFNQLRYHPRAIDFFITAVVLCIELKQFPHKLVSTPWDLVNAGRRHPLTGFSGTCDTQWLLPIGVEQLKLPELRDTNARVLTALLRPENGTCLALKANAPPQALLDLVTECSARVLLDVGALVLEDNETFARTWLQHAPPEFEAVVFFKGNRKVAWPRRGRTVLSLADSPWANNLGVCLVYLDEEHTRGTDLRLPLGTKAAVTLGARLTRDRMVQGCLRMRQLGQGHSVAFIAADDVAQQLEASGGLLTDSVLAWVLRNTQQALKMGAAHWLQQGATSLITDHHLWQPLRTGQLQIDSLPRGVRQEDARPLSMSYALVRQQHTLPDICETITSKLPTSPRLQALKDYCRTYFGAFPPRYSTLLDEEQERELEKEQEEERQTQHAPRRSPAKAILSEALTKTVATGQADARLLPLDKVIERVCPRLCSLWSTSRVCATEGYLNTVAQEPIYRYRFMATHTTERQTSVDLQLFLRPVMWVLVLADGALVLLAPWEAQYAAEQMKSEAFVSLISLRLLAPRVLFDGDECWDDARLALEVAGAKKIGAPATAAVAEMRLFAGALFWGSMEEQLHVLAMLGVILRPHTEAEANAFEQGFIEGDGFVLIPARQYALKIELDKPLSESKISALREFLRVHRDLAYFMPFTHLDLVLNQTVMADVSYRYRALSDPPDVKTLTVHPRAEERVAEERERQRLELVERERLEALERSERERLEAAKHEELAERERLAAARREEWAGHFDDCWPPETSHYHHSRYHDGDSDDDYDSRYDYDSYDYY